MSYKKLLINKDDLFYQISSSTPGVSNLAYAAISAKLYVRGWNMIDDLINLYDTPDGVRPAGKIVLCTYNEIPVGVAVQMDWGHREFFVRGKFRLNGIGTKMNQALVNETSWNEKIYAKSGRMDCVRFFERIGVELRDG